MVQTPLDDAVQALLGDLEGGILAEVLVVEKATEDGVVEGALVGQAVDVLGGVGVDGLKRAGELIIETLNERDNAAGNLEVLLALRDGGEMVIVIPLLSALNNDVVLLRLEDLQERGKVTLSGLPLVQGHLGGAAGTEIEAGGNKGLENTDPLVRGDGGDLVEGLHDLDLLEAVGVLLAAGLDDGAEVLEDALGGVLNDLAARIDRREALVVLLLLLGADDGSLGEPEGLGNSLGRGDLVVTLHEGVGILPVGVDLGLVVLVVLADALLDGVETTGICRVHLLGGDLLLGESLVHEVLKVGNGLDVGLGGLAAILELDDLAVELVEFYRVGGK